MLSTVVLLLSLCGVALPWRSFCLNRCLDLESVWNIARNSIRLNPLVLELCHKLLVFLWKISGVLVTNGGIV